MLEHSRSLIDGLTVFGESCDQLWEMWLTQDRVQISRIRLFLDALPQDGSSPNTRDDMLSVAADLNSGNTRLRQILAAYRGGVTSLYTQAQAKYERTLDRAGIAELERIRRWHGGVRSGLEVATQVLVHAIDHGLSELLRVGDTGLFPDWLKAVLDLGREIHLSPVISAREYGKTLSHWHNHRMIVPLFAIPLLAYYVALTAAMCCLFRQEGEFLKSELGL